MVHTVSLLFHVLFVVVDIWLANNTLCLLDSRILLYYVKLCWLVGDSWWWRVYGQTADVFIMLSDALNSAILAANDQQWCYIWH